MNAYLGPQRWFFLVMTSSLLIAAGSSAAPNEDIHAKYEASVSLAARVLKDVYQPNEPVPLVIAIANHGSEPVYLFAETLDISGTSAGVTDANGLRVTGDLVPTPPPSPPHYHMETDGKQIYVVPVSATCSRKRSKEAASNLSSGIWDILFRSFRSSRARWYASRMAAG